MPYSLKNFHLFRAIKIILTSTPGWTLLNISLLTILGLLPLYLLYLMKLIIDTIAASINSPAPEEGIKKFLILIAFTALVSFLDIIVHAVVMVTRENQSRIIIENMQDIIHSKSIEVDLEYYENPQYHDTLHRAQREAKTRPVNILNNILQFWQYSVSLLAVIGLLFYLHWIVAVILFIALVPEIVTRIFFAEKMYQWERGQTNIERKTDYFNWIMTRDTYAKELRLFKLGDIFKSRFNNLIKQLRLQRMNIIKQRSKIETLTHIFIILALFGSYSIIGYKTITGCITIGSLVMYFRAFQFGQDFLRNIMNCIANLFEDNLFLANLFEFIDLKPKVLDPKTPKPIPKKIKSGIVLENVSFSYPSNGKMVLENINLSIEPGQVVALAGENGAGKTTIIKLLCRFYNPTKGRILIDGIDIKDIPVNVWRSKISALFQDYSRYNLSVKENIWIGDTNIPQSNPKINEAASLAGVHEMIDKLPKKYDTILGRWFAEGEELSQGEWQKISLARAFLRNSELIILDEPNSSMDAKTEDEIMSKFKKLVHQKSGIIISHRFSTVKMADQIYFIKDGKIIEKGSHNQLMELNGKYKKMFVIQAKHYNLRD